MSSDRETLLSSEKEQNHGSCSNMDETKKTCKKYLLQSSQSELVFSHHLLNCCWPEMVILPGIWQSRKGRREQASGTVRWRALTWCVLIISCPQRGLGLKCLRRVQKVSRERSVEANLWWTRIPGSRIWHGFLILLDQVVLHAHHHHAGPSPHHLVCF